MFLDCSHVLPARTPANLSGVTVADLDGDGQFEFLLAAANGANRVFKWSGQSLRDIAPPVLADQHRDSLGSIAADFDGDGREEIYLINDGPGTDRLFDFQPDGRWVDLFERPIHKPARNPHAKSAVATLDRRGHGRYSFVVTSHGQPLRLCELIAPDSITDLAPALGIAVPVHGGGLCVGPFASQRSDIFCANARGSNLLFRNTGLGTFLEVASEHGLRDCQERGHAAVPVDVRGRLNIAFGNRDGPHRLFLRQAEGKFRNIATPAMGMSSDVRSVVAADFDNDGYEELLFLNADEPNRLFRQTAHEDNVWSLALPGAADGCGIGAAIADVDHDGRLELLITHGHSTQLFKWPDTGNNWLRVLPLTRFGAPARGAVVQLACERPQLRVICGGSGSRCQMEPVAHFGLGIATQVDRIQVTWPDDSTAMIEHPPMNRMLVVKYPG